MPSYVSEQPFRRREKHRRYGVLRVLTSGTVLPRTPCASLDSASPLPTLHSANASARPALGRETTEVVLRLLVLRLPSEPMTILPCASRRTLARNMQTVSRVTLATVPGVERRRSWLGLLNNRMGTIQMHKDACRYARWSTDWPQPTSCPLRCQARSLLRSLEHVRRARGRRPRRFRSRIAAPSQCREFSSLKSRRCTTLAIRIVWWTKSVLGNVGSAIALLAPANAVTQLEPPTSRCFENRQSRFTYAGVSVRTRAANYTEVVRPANPVAKHSSAIHCSSQSRASYS